MGYSEDVRTLVATEKRANAIDAEWVERPVEAAWRAKARTRPSRFVARDLAELLAGSDLESSRYLGWLALPVIPDADLPLIAEGLGNMTSPDARVVVASLLIGRAASVPAWLRRAIERTLAEAAPLASRNMEATLDVLRKAAAEPDRFAPQAGLAHGARLFNAGRWFDAHEAWEDLWRPMRGAERDFFRGLINLAVAMKKAAEGNPDGLLRLLDRASSMLRPYAPAHRGVDITALLAALEQLSSEARAWRDGTRLGIDATHIPVLPES